MDDLEQQAEEAKNILLQPGYDAADLWSVQQPGCPSRQLAIKQLVKTSLISVINEE